MSTNLFATKYSALNKPIYTSFGGRIDGDTIREMGNAYKANTYKGDITGSDFGFGTHGHVDGRKQAILDSGMSIIEGQYLNIFG